MIADGSPIPGWCQADLRIAGPHARFAERVIKHLHQAAARGENLRAERRRGFDNGALVVGKEEKGFENGAELIFAGLACHHDRDDLSQVVGDGMKDGVGDFCLIGIEGLADDVVGEALDGGHGQVGAHDSSVALYEKR